MKPSALTEKCKAEVDKHGHSYESKGLLFESCIASWYVFLEENFPWSFLHMADLLAESILAFHCPCADFGQQLGMCSVANMATIGLALIEAMALLALSCHESGVRLYLRLVYLMAAVRLDHSLDCEVRHDAPSIAALA